MENFNISTNTIISAKSTPQLGFFFFVPPILWYWKIGENFPQKIAKLVENLHLEKQKKSQRLPFPIFFVQEKDKKFAPHPKK